MALEILIVDDEPDIRTLVSGILEDEGYQTREAGDSDTAINAIAARRPGLVLLDIWLQGSQLDGMGILDVIHADHPGIPVIMMSGHGNIETAVSAINKGAYDFIEKPFNSDRLLLIARRALEDSRLRRENEELRIRAGTENHLIGKSPNINQVRQIIDKVAPANSRVLISGPAGCGKEVVARMLHEQSQRANGPFIVLNCAAMDPEKFENELFGIEDTENQSGQKKVGTFEQAHNGTLFLDEVADMPMETQGKIVRVLQEQIFERVGGSTRVEVDVRVVAASSKNLAEEMAEGRFREDLFYRLSVVPIEVPPLSERLEDIAPLAQHFIERAGESTGHSARQLASDAIAALQAYNWPGNVRELRNVIERMLIMNPGPSDTPVTADMLPKDIGGVDTGAQDFNANMGGVIGLPLRKAREVFEREYLHSQITRFSGNISRTAAFVGMERSALHRKLKSLGITSGATSAESGEGNIALDIKTGDEQ